MIVKSKWIAITLLISGLMIALGHGYLFLDDHTAWNAFMFLVGIGWIWIGTTNLRRLQNADPK